MWRDGLIMRSLVSRSLWMRMRVVMVGEALVTA